MKKLFLIAGVLVLAVAGIFIFYAMRFGFDAATSAGTPPTSDVEVAKILEKVGEHIRLPNESPVVSVITDIDLLAAQQPFYTGAKNGDILLIYPNVSRAILFDPDEDRIVNVGPIIFENPEGGPEESEEIVE